jgi:hypothetical protein
MFIEKLSTWRKLSKKNKRLFWEALFFLSVTKIIVWLVPFKYIAPYLGTPNKEVNDQEDISIQLANAKAIADAIRLAVRYTPWKVVCLPQALAAHKMLKRHKLSGTLFLGITKSDGQNKSLKAHAWLRHGDLILCGAKGHKAFTVVSTFSW